MAAGGDVGVALPGGELSTDGGGRRFGDATSGGGVEGAEVGSAVEGGSGFDDDQRGELIVEVAIDLAVFGGGEHHGEHPRSDTDEDAERLAASIDLRRLQMDMGLNGPIPTLAEAAAHRYSEGDRLRIRQHRQRAIVGSPGRVRTELLALRDRFQADEIVVVTITGDYASRLRSYELLAQAMDLPG